MRNELNQKTFRISMLRRFKGKGIPVEGIFELTGRCNLNCKMCYIHTQSNDVFAKGEKSGDWWISVIDAACNAGMLFALLSGGECMMHPDFRRIYLHLRSKGVFVRVNTNGLLLTQDNIDFLKRYPPLEIQMTLYGTDDDAYEMVTGVRAFKKAEQAIQRLKDSGLPFSIAVTPNSFAPGETERIIDYLQDQHVTYSVNGGLFSPYSDNENVTLSEFETSIEEKIAYLSLKRKEALKRIPLEELPPVGGGRSEPVCGLTCSAQVSFFITWDGYMQPCNAFYGNRLPLASSGDFFPTWKRILQHNREYSLPMECEGCVYKPVCLSCPVLRGGDVGNGHCDPKICEMTRRLVAAGVKRLDCPEPEGEDHGV